jgi:hypothetical protein
MSVSGRAHERSSERALFVAPLIHRSTSFVLDVMRRGRGGRAEPKRDRRGPAMRFLVQSRPKFPVPPEQFPALMDAFAGWRDRHRALMEGFYFFAEGAGGCGILNAPDAETVGQMFMEYPFGPYSDTRLDLIVDGDAMIARWQEMFRQMAGAQG